MGCHAGSICFEAKAAAAKKEAEEKSPVTKIVGLIKELKTKIVADGKAEQNLYNKYACWCETTTARARLVPSAASALGRWFLLCYP